MDLHEYERLLAPARERFAASPGVRAIQSSQDAAFLESFLLHFSALGSRMTAPVEGWICAAAERCAAIGLPELARALRGHARAEAGHDLMMIADVRSSPNTLPETADVWCPRVPVRSHGMCARLWRRRVIREICRCRIGSTRSERCVDRSSSRAVDDRIFELMSASLTLIRLTFTPTTSWHTTDRGSLAVSGCIA